MKKHEYLIQSLKNNAVNFYQETLWSHTGKNALAYIRSRGISDQTIKNMSIGYAPGNRALRDRFDRELVDIDLSLDSGLLQRSEKNDQIYDYFNNYIIFPVFVGSNAITLTGRTLEKEYRTKYIHLKGAPRNLYNYNVIDQATHIIIVESPFNALSLMEWGYQAVASLGSSSFQPKYAAKFEGKQVYIIYDNDENQSGQKGAVKTAKLLFKEALIDAYIVSMPVGIDVNDYFLMKSKESFARDIMINKTKFSSTSEFKKWMEEIEAQNKKPTIKLNKSDSSLEAALHVPIIEIIKMLNISVTKYGNMYKSICPLPGHSETIDSFTVYTESNTVKCFGCGFFGDNITLVRRMTGLTFKNAIKFILKSYKPKGG